ncbi:9755_t:CDS:10 [Funneliformis mosseae]|uniref:9755_t:CDS:1 n=1 Tax=Funneliformis mosseae TaxID=27381 RepID=A0A9N9DLH2_FUNMO|nr:9755_t:CDS:10 [Funneliformis mosseae]
MNSLLTVKSNAEEPDTSDGKVSMPDASNGNVNKPDTFNGNVTVPDTFKVVRDNENVIVHLVDKVLVKYLRNLLPGESLYDVNPKISSHELFLAFPDLKKAPLVDWIEKEYQSKVSQIKQMTDRNVITYKSLFYLFPKGQHVRAVWNEHTVGAKVIKASYHSNYHHEYMIVQCEVIDSDGVSFIRGTKSFFVESWEGVCKIEELSVVPLSKENPIRDELVTRGRKFVKYAIGRVMIDTVSFTKTNPSYNMDTARRVVNNVHNNKYNVKTVCEEDLFMCAPSCYGFSFVAKKWGQIYVEHIEDVKFDDDVFNQLVMDPIKKELILSLVTSKYKGVDLISGKGGGCIFLLHGPPGVGKTLTAEAISEFLHRPLYSVSVGELGTKVVDLESKLSEILDVASVWNAVILIDEADIFLERRSEDDIKRNALVSIFLRLLEYHQGILFLTTNRVNCFDTAFTSRISVALKYNELDADAREQLWRTFLDRVEGKGKTQVNINYLKERPLNGREIKTAVRLAKALTTKDNPDALITTQQLEAILDISKSFTEEIFN